MAGLYLSIGKVSTVDTVDTVQVDTFPIKKHKPAIF